MGYFSGWLSVLGQNTGKFLNFIYSKYEFFFFFLRDQKVKVSVDRMIIFRMSVIKKPTLTSRPACLGDWIRTSGLLHPMQTRYQAALHPDKGKTKTFSTSLHYPGRM